MRSVIRCGGDGSGSECIRIDMVPICSENGNLVQTTFFLVHDPDASPLVFCDRRVSCFSLCWEMEWRLGVQEGRDRHLIALSGGGNW